LQALFQKREGYEAGAGSGSVPLTSGSGSGYGRPKTCGSGSPTLVEANKIAKSYSNTLKTISPHVKVLFLFFRLSRKISILLHCPVVVLPFNKQKLEKN
jgi:hypothetical protein